MTSSPCQAPQRVEGSVGGAYIRHHCVAVSVLFIYAHCIGPWLLQSLIQAVVAGQPTDRQPWCLSMLQIADITVYFCDKLYNYI